MKKIIFLLITCCLLVGCGNGSNTSASSDVGGNSGSQQVQGQGNKHEVKSTGNSMDYYMEMAAGMVLKDSAAYGRDNAFHVNNYTYEQVDGNLYKLYLDMTCEGKDEPYGISVILDTSVDKWYSDNYTTIKDDDPQGLQSNYSYYINNTQVNWQKFVGSDE